MKRPLAICLAVALVWSVGCRVEGGASRHDIIHDTFPADQAAVTKVLTELVEAAEKKELDRVDSFHLYGPKFSKFDESGGQRQDAATSQAAERKGLGAVKSFTAQIEDLKVDVFGAVAIATFVLNYSVEVSAGVFPSNARSTMIFTKEGGTWKIVHEHHSVLKASP